MKNNFKIFALTALVSLAAACGGGNELEKKKSELEQLKAQQAELTSKIKTIEEEIIAIGDTSANPNEKFKFVKTTSIAKTEFLHFIDVQGRIDGDQNTLISARAMAPVTKVYVKPGANVKKDQILAELDAEIVKRQIDDLKTNLNYVTDVFNKQKALWDKEVGSEIQYLTAKTNKESLEQKLATLYENLDMYKIKSPINGTVDEVFLKIGNGEVLDK